MPLSSGTQRLLPQVYLRTIVYSVIYASGSVPRRAIFSPRETTWP